MLTRLDITSSGFQFHFSAFECFWWFDINSYGCQLHLVKSWGPLHWSQQISSKQSQWRDSLQDTPMVDGKICPTNSTSQCQVWWWDLHLLLNFSIFWCWRPILLLAIPWYLYKGCRPCRRPRNKQPRLADLLGVSHHFEWAIFRLSNNLTCLPSVISYLENCRPKQPLLLLLLTEE